MIKRLTHWSPRDALSREEALRYWKEEHAPLLERVPGVRRYVQNHCTPGPDGAEPPYAGLGEVWFDDLAAVNAALQTPSGRRSSPTQRRSWTMERISAAWAEEHVVL
jgi:uncharacterized protein (TIGR02118 family)